MTDPAIELSVSYVRSAVTVVGPDLNTTVELLAPHLGIVTVGTQGPAGPKGDNGGTGGAQPFTWSPNSAQATWVVPHNLGRFPLVQYRDPSGEFGFPDVAHLDINTCMISFHAPVLGAVDLI